MKKILDTVLLLALPASGKSEVRRYLRHLSPKVCGDEFHMGPTVQLDDFPYVHLMRRIDDELERLGKTRVFFKSGERPFIDPRDWGTLIQLVNEDYDDLVAHKALKPAAVAPFLFDRIDDAAAKVGIPARLGKLDAGTRAAAAKVLEKEASEWLKEKLSAYPDTLKGKTLVIEFARGGPDGSSMPLKAPFGYEYSIGRLSPAILEKATILYVWVTPEESRRKNQARTDPNDPGSILHHGVPLEVMMNDYGCCDMDWLEAHSKTPGTVTVSAGGKKYVLPIGRFDNRRDKTSFLRADPKDWKPADVKAVHEGLRGALDRLAAFG
ncbi:MAG: hypothetical protein A2V88_14825 [Elusimicrobia bacterium RBG_16_66_12]|nr:MAG: hypothetical protein A2V88_14825 [Elusimicrobia bacterium RBG_16_66_12]